MSDSRFFKTAKPFTLGELAAISGAVIGRGSAADGPFYDIAPLDTATEKDVSFFYDKSFVASIAASKAGVCLTTEDMLDAFPVTVKVLVSKDVKKAFALIARAFYPKSRPVPFISDKAYISPSAKLGKDLRIEAGAFIGDNVEIGDYSLIEANAVLKSGVVIGKECEIRANASVSHAFIGNNVTIFSGACIGEDGFGFYSSAEGHLRIPQVGRVIIEDNVEVGANSCIDRGALGDTVIASGTVIDNLVQIGHNNKVGHNCVFCGQVGVAGSCTFGDFVVVAGQVGIADHINIGSGVQMGAQSGIMKDVEDGHTVMGTPASPVRDYFRQVATLRKLSGSKK